MAIERKALNIRLPKELMDWLDDYSRRSGLSKNAAIIAAVADFRDKVQRWQKRKGELWIPPAILR